MSRQCLFSFFVCVLFGRCQEDAGSLSFHVFTLFGQGQESVCFVCVLFVCVLFERCQEDAGTCELPEGPAAPESPLELLRPKVRGEEL